GKAARGAECGQVESARDERRVIARGRDRDAPASHDAVQAQPLEHAEGDPFGHALGEPLLGAPLALCHHDSRHVRPLVRPYPPPPAARATAAARTRRARTLLIRAAARSARAWAS